MRIIAVDWSGAASGADRRIWLAEVRDGRLVRLESGRSREHLTAHLIEEAARDPDLIVGLDFAFSFPAWYLESHGIEEVSHLWRLAAERGEAWLAACETPFWGRPGKGKPGLSAHFRRTEQEAQAVAGTFPKSVFQIGGAGAVGTGSIRGMPALAKLAGAGFSVWPFHPVHLPMIVEIYPRLLTGAVTKSDAAARARYLEAGFPEMEGAHRAIAASSEDALDAAVSAIVMYRHLEELTTLEGCRDDVDALEGRIWWPSRPAAVPSPTPPRSVSACPFCALSGPQITVSNEVAIAIPDRFPIAAGHTLVMPMRHVESVFELGDVEQRELWALVARVRETLEQKLRPDGFTIGVNDGAAAGQTIPHAHVHIVPRFAGDVQDPRGGLRWVIPERAVYWE